MQTENKMDKKKSKPSKTRQCLSPVVIGRKTVHLGHDACPSLNQCKDKQSRHPFTHTPNTITNEPNDNEPSTHVVGLWEETVLPTQAQGKHANYKCMGCSVINSFTS